MDISIILVNWNSINYLRPCLVSILSGPKEFEYEIIVVDNDSKDRCGEILAQEFPSVVFIQSKQNLGFSGGNNLAASHAQGKALLLLNPDTELRGDALNILYRSFLSCRDAGALGAHLLNTDGTVQTSCIQAFPTLLNQFLDSNLLRRLFPQSRLWGTAPLSSSSSAPVPVEVISGACLMTPRDLYLKLGGLSLRYFMYFEDTDYCFRCSQAGRKNFYVPSAIVTHHGGKSSGGGYSRFSSVMMAESAERYFRHQRGSAGAKLFRAITGLKALGRIALLACLYVILLFVGRQKRAWDSLRKWGSVFNWAIGRETAWLAQYSQSRPSPA